MGNDAALACLSDQPRMPYDYFKQLFAQVTNPPIDSIREEIIMSLECYIGPERNLLETTDRALRTAADPAPDPQQPGAGRHAADAAPRLAEPHHRHDVPCERRARRAWPRRWTGICREAEEAIDDGYSLIILSDRATGPERVPVSSLAGLRRRASPSGAAGQANTAGHRAGNGRSPRSPSPLPAGRLRGRRHQSVLGL